jgi:hypothetical protein
LIHDFCGALALAEGENIFLNKTTIFSKIFNYLIRNVSVLPPCAFKYFVCDTWGEHDVWFYDFITNLFFKVILSHTKKEISRSGWIIKYGSIRKKFRVFELEKSKTSWVFLSFGKCILYTSILIDEMAVWHASRSLEKERLKVKQGSKTSTL